jgi:DNA-directed RNA polymerase specialized sigma24 family protein
MRRITAATSFAATDTHLSGIELPTYHVMPSPKVGLGATSVPQCADVVRTVEPDVCVCGQQEGQRDQLLQQDRYLIAKVVQGDASAIEELFCNRFGRSAVFLAARFHMAPHEILSDLYWHLSEDNWRRLRTWRGDASLKRWLELVSVRLSLKSVKDSARFTPLEELEGGLVNSEERQSATDAAEISSVLEAINKLPSGKMRLVARLSFEGVDPVRIAEILNLKRGYVDTLKCRAISGLREILHGRAMP